MRQTEHRQTGTSFTLIELLCVMVIITILAGLLLGPLSKVLRKGRAIKWESEAPIMLQATVQQLQRYFAGKQHFPKVTLTFIESRHLVEPPQLQFLKDRRVTFVPFASSDPDDQAVILVKVEAGFEPCGSLLTETKGRITTPPE